MLQFDEKTSFFIFYYGLFNIGTTKLTENALLNFSWNANRKSSFKCVKIEGSILKLREN